MKFEKPICRRFKNSKTVFKMSKRVLKKQVLPIPYMYVWPNTGIFSTNRVYQRIIFHLLSTINFSVRFQTAVFVSSPFISKRKQNETTVKQIKTFPTLPVGTIYMYILYI